MPLELEARLAAHCAAWDEPAADVVADAVELMLDGFEEVSEAGPASDQVAYACDAAAALAGFVS